MATGWLSLLLLNITEPTDAGGLNPITIVPDAEFHQIEAPKEYAITDTIILPPVPVKPKPKISLPHNPPVIISNKIQQPKPQKLNSRHITGIASFYCSLLYHSRCTRGYSGGYYAAIRKDLLYLRGKIIKVCASNCIHVKIIDCNCGPNANLIDLYSDAFNDLAPLSRGKVKVTISW